MDKLAKLEDENQEMKTQLIDDKVKITELRGQVAKLKGIIETKMKENFELTKNLATKNANFSPKKPFKPNNDANKSPRQF